jgi:type IV secretory pathway TrbL component
MADVYSVRQTSSNAGAQIAAANAGAKGPIGSTVKPVHAGGEMGGHHDTAAYRNTTKDLIGKVGNTPAQGTQKPSPATRPSLGQAGGVNNKSIVPGKHN